MKSYLCIFIGSKLYHLQALEGDVRGWNLTKPDGEVYTIHQEGKIWLCTCADATFRKDKVGKKCKHVDALLKEKLL